MNGLGQREINVVIPDWDNPEGWYGEGGGRRVQDGFPSFPGGAQVRPLPWESGVGIGIAVLGCLFISWDSVLGARSR